MAEVLFFFFERERHILILCAVLPYRPEIMVSFNFARAAGETSPTLLQFVAALEYFTCVARSTGVWHAFMSLIHRTRYLDWYPCQMEEKYITQFSLRQDRTLHCAEHKPTNVRLGTSFLLHLSCNNDLVMYITRWPAGPYPIQKYSTAANYFVNVFKTQGSGLCGSLHIWKLEIHSDQKNSSIFRTE